MTIPLLALRRFAAAALIGALAIPAACGEAGEDPPVAGRLVIVGGGLAPDNEAVYRAVLDGREGSGPVCVLPTAGGDPEASMASAVERLDEWGGPGTAVGVLLTETDPARADDPEVGARLRTCSGFFFTGGSQTRIVDTFRPGGRATAAYDAVMERWRAGAVVAGTSAGAAMMGGRMIAGGGSPGALAHGVVERGNDDGVVVAPGMGFFERGWLDQHFLVRGRWGRLLVATLQEPTYDVGFGIDENTALVVDGRHGLVVGASGVVVIDGRDDPTLDLLGAGDRIDLETLAVTPAKDRRPAPAFDDPGAGEDAEDPFARLRLLRDVARTAPTSARLRYEAARGVVLELVPDSGFRAESAPGGAGEGPGGTPRGLSAGPYRIVGAGPLGG